MGPNQSFTFGIPIMPRACARNWRLLEELCGLTLASVLAQTDDRFSVIVCGHDRPRTLPTDRRVRFVQADWPVESVSPDNRDRGRKVERINALSMENGGGLLMFLDADDWVDARLVEAARATMDATHAAGLIEYGAALDFRRLRHAKLPHPEVFDRPFHRICGSSVVLRLSPEHPDPLSGDPHAVLHEHYRVPEAAWEAGLCVTNLPVAGCYLVNTSDSHSEVHGPFAKWRREFNEVVNALGSPVDEQFLARFGLEPGQVRQARKAATRSNRPAP